MVVDPCVNKQKTNFLALTNPACTNMHGMSTVISPYYLLHVSSSLCPSCLPLCFFLKKRGRDLITIPVTTHSCCNNIPVKTIIQIVQTLTAPDFEKSFT